jgi:arylsulfatase A-like enzyme
MGSRLAGGLVAKRSVLAFLAILSACARPVSPPTRIVLVVIDTLRADRLGAYGSTRGLTPFLDSIAGRAVVFRNAWAAAPYTRPSVASLFTSRYPSEHGVTDFAGLALAEGETTLAEVLSGHGWGTAAVLGTPVLARRSGFAQGFSLYDEPKQAKRPGNLLNTLALASLPMVGARGPTFLYLHYMEPHVPWAPPADLLARVRPGLPVADLSRLNRAYMVANLVPPDAATRAGMEAVYDAEVAAVDGELRGLLGFLERQRLLESAVVVITADHGEAFGDHAAFGHGNSLYEEQIHVPLLVLLPGQSTGRIVDEPVSLIDVAPTLLDLAGIAVPASFEGRSLRPQLEAGLARYLEGPWAGHVPVVAELLTRPGLPEVPVPWSHHERAIRFASRKLIRTLEGTDEAYDLRDDPDELRRDTVSDDRLTVALGDFVVRHPRTLGGPKSAVDPETAERLKALGYLVDPRRTGPAPPSPRP